MKVIESIVVKQTADPGLSWLRHMNSESAYIKYMEEKKKTDQLDPAGYSLQFLTENGQTVGYQLDFYNEETLIAWRILK